MSPTTSRHNLGIHAGGHLFKGPVLCLMPNEMSSKKEKNDFLTFQQLACKNLTRHKTTK